MKKATLMLTIILAISANVFAANTNDWGGPVITAKDKVNAQQFIALKGSDRLNAFKKIQTLILVREAVSTQQAEKMGVSPSLKSDIQNIMGVPDVITEGGFWVYNLKDNSSSCKVVLGFDKTSQVIFFTIKDCL